MNASSDDMNTVLEVPRVLDQDIIRDIVGTYSHCEIFGLFSYKMYALHTFISILFNRIVSFF